MNNAILRLSAVKCSNTGLESAEQHRTDLLQYEVFRWIKCHMENKERRQHINRFRTPDITAYLEFETWRKRNF